MEIFDAHTHFFWRGYFPPRWHRDKAAQWAGRRWPRPDTEGLPERIEAGLLDPDAELLLADLAAAGIDRALTIGLDPWPALRDGSNPGGANDIVEHIQAHAAALAANERLLGFTSVDPRRPDAAAIVRWAVAERGFRGVKIYTPHGFHPFDPLCHPIYAECVALDVPVMYHSASAAFPLVSEYANPLLVQPVQREFPELSIILGHAGHPLWQREAAFVCASHPNTYLEVSNWDGLLQRDPEQLIAALSFMVNEVGAHRMLFGSDHHAVPFDRGKLRDHLCRWVHFAREVDIFKPGERELFLAGNISRLLKLDPGKGESDDGTA